MANLITAPKHWDNKVILAKTETTYNTDSTPTGAANWIEARNVNFVPLDPVKVARNVELPYLGNAGDVIVGQWAKLSYDVALAPSGAAGTAPKFSPLLLACAFAETITAATSAAYNLVSSSFSSLSQYINIDGINHVLTGGRGNVKAKMDAQGVPMLSFEWDAIYAAPTAVALPSVTRTGWMREEGINSANTLPIVVNGVNCAMSSLEWNLGNEIERIDLPGPQVEVAITDRKPTGSLTILAPTLATLNPYTLATAGTVIAISQTHGSAAGKKAKTDLNATISNVEYAQIGKLAGYKLSLDLVPVSGNDEVTLTFT